MPSLLKDYQNQQKKRNMTNRKKYEENLNKLLDISHPHLEKRFAEDRIWRGGDFKICHSSRFREVKGKWPRGNWMKSLVRRNLGSVPSSTIISQDIHSEDQNDIFGESSPTKEGTRDEEFNNQEKKGQEIRLYHSGTAS